MHSIQGNTIVVVIRALKTFFNHIRELLFKIERHLIGCKCRWVEIIPEFYFHICSQKGSMNILDNSMNHINEVNVWKFSNFKYYAVYQHRRKDLDGSFFKRIGQDLNP